jgi:threonine dehydratase
MSLELDDVRSAMGRIRELARLTPLLPAHREAGPLAGCYLKLENLQLTGSFKLRGALNKLSALPAQARQAGVVAVSTGNHGRAVAYAARRLEIPATICLSSGVPANKVGAIRRLGARVVDAGQTYDQAAAYAEELCASSGAAMVHPFDDDQVIAGQGTIGLELSQQLPQVARVIVPLSGGGLIGGIALTLKALKPSIRVIGVSMERGPVMYASLKAGRPVELPEEPTLADALAGGIGLDNRFTFELVRRLVDDVVLVDEQAIGEAMLYAAGEEHMLVEGGGAVGLAALLQERIPASNDPTVVVLSGGNVSLRSLAALSEEQAARG